MMKTSRKLFRERHKKVNEQSRPCGILRETQSLELLTENDLYFLSDMNWLEYNRDENQR